MKPRTSSCLPPSKNATDAISQIFGELLDFLGAKNGALLARQKRRGDRGGRWNLILASGTGEVPFSSFEKLIPLVEDEQKTSLLLDASAAEKGSADFSIYLPLRISASTAGIAYVEGRMAISRMDALANPRLYSIARRLAAAVSAEYPGMRENETREFRPDEYGGGGSRSRIVGCSASVREMRHLVVKASASSLPVLIQGETGTGKEIIARAIHYGGPRSRRVLMAQNCAAMPESLLESELFGHARGAFTGADANKRGLLAAADGGTVFLDEISECSRPLQSKLLRVLENGIVRPVGSTREKVVDVRIIAATNRDLEEEVRKGNFRKDLFYRLNVFPIKVPPLRERMEDIPLLAAHFLSRCMAGRSVNGFSEGAMRLLASYDFPGNVRELENEVMRLVALHEKGDCIAAEELSPRIHDAALSGNRRRQFPHGRRLRDFLRDAEKRIILEMLDSCAWNVSLSARQLGLSRYGLYKKILAHGIKPDHP